MNADSSQKKNISRDMVGHEVAGLLGGIAGFGLGSALLLDDAKDLGKFSTPDHPSPIHHWQIGLCLMIASLIGICASGLSLIKKYMNHNRK